MKKKNLIILSKIEFEIMYFSNYTTKEIYYTVKTALSC